MNTQSGIVAVCLSAAIALVLMVNGQDLAQQPQGPPQSSQQVPSYDQTNTLPAGAELIIGQLKPGFTCDNKVYGYYADVANDCRVFHVCWPITDEHGATLNKEWTFICGNQTLFNQERLVCDRPENVVCSQAESFYSVNNEFGKIPGAQ